MERAPDRKAAERRERLAHSPSTDVVGVLLSLRVHTAPGAGDTDPAPGHVAPQKLALGVQPQPSGMLLQLGEGGHCLDLL